LVIIIALFRGTTFGLGGFISDISSKKKINISFFFTTANSVENNLGLSSLIVFLVYSRSYYDSDLSFIIIYAAEKVSLFKILVLIIVSRKLLFLSPRIKVLIIS
jgi:hypothetical protein